MTIRAMAPKVLDAWSPYDFKATITGAQAIVEVPQWIMPEDERRLRSYTLLESYCQNASRYWLEDKDAATKSGRREYGDPSVIVETTLSSLIGNEWKIVVDGAMGSEVPAAVVVQELLDKWADDEKFGMKLIENERQAIKLGDGVYVLGWDDDKGRPRCNVYDPGMYFPVFNERDGSNNEDYPNKVHICYEFCEKDRLDREVIYVRRMTWELIEVPVWQPAYQAEKSSRKVHFSDIIFDLGDIGKDYNTVAGNRGEVMADEVLEIDYLPVVHIPNTVSLRDHFGRSTLATPLQIIDDIQSTDTDLQRSASTTGSPPIVVTGVAGGGSATTYGPGMLMYVGQGDAHIMDTSTSLDALLKLKDALLERLSVNSRIPESLLGRVKPNEVPSGIALTLSFTPHIGMIREMRLVRQHKYTLLFKMVLRMFLNAGVIPAGDLPKVKLFMGSFLPADKQETATNVIQLYQSKVISLETAVQMVMEAGYPIEDWIEEISRIESRDYDSANQLLSMTGDPNRALEYLGQPPMTEDEIMADQNAQDPNAQDPNAPPAT